MVGFSPVRWKFEEVTVTSRQVAKSSTDELQSSATLAGNKAGIKKSMEKNQAGRRNP